MKTMHVDTLFRPAYEARAAAAWAFALVWVVGLAIVTNMAPPALFTMLALAFLMLGLRAWQTSRVWGFKLRLCGEAIVPVSTTQMNSVQDQLHDKTWMGWGWEWQPSHTQRAYEIAKRDKKEIYPPHWWLKHFGGGIDPYNSVGKAWLHGLEAEEDIVVPNETFIGHTGIIATTGALKTSLYKLLVYQFALQGHCVIIIDPKGDKDLYAAGRDAAIALGDPDRFISFRPAFPSSSVRLDGLKNWDRETQVASRVKQIISASDDDNFINFCWTVTTNLVGSMKIVGRRPTIASLLDHVQSLENPEKLCEEVLYTFLSPRFPNLTQLITDRGRLADAGQKGGNQRGRGGLAERASARLIVLIQIFRELPVEERPRAISGLIAMLDANREWFSKMITAMVPTLTKIASLGPLMSPDYDDIGDTRPIYDVKKIVDGRKIFYCGIDALSDASVASAVAALLIADAAGYAGETYNYAEGKPPIVDILIDEAGDATSETLIQNLNKGRGAGLRIYLAMQSIADLVVALGNNEALAERVLSNLNNFIIGATRDPRTLEFLERQLGEVSVMLRGVSQGSGQKTEDLGLEYSANRSVTLKEMPQALVPGNLISALPNLHYISILNRAQVRKGRIPILKFQ
jgi:conjugal transfer pilus assembly protein TraD